MSHSNDEVEMIPSYLICLRSSNARTFGAFMLLTLLPFALYGIPGQGKVPAKAQTVTESVWVAKQVNNYMGPTTLYVSDHAVKFVAQGGDLIVVGREPDWECVIYRTKEGVIGKQSLEKLREHGLQLFKGRTALSYAPRISDYDRILRQPCYRIVGRTRGRSFEANDPAIFRSTHKVSEREVHFESTSKIQLPPKVMQFLAGLYRLSDREGIPLEQSYLLTDGSTLKEFYTTSLEKEQLPNTFFDFPRHLKPVSLQSPTLYISSDKQKCADDLLKSVIEDMGQKDTKR